MSARFNDRARCLRSPALAAQQTAEALRLPAESESDLRECDYGRWAGRSLETVQADDPVGMAQWLRDPASCPHGGESLLALLARVAAWLDGLRGQSDQIVAITHASVVRAAIVAALGSPPPAFWRIDIAPLSVTKLTCNGILWTLVAANERLRRSEFSSPI
ncbi:histidine phosphatase family protein [Hyphomicrobiales bacterium BP6-180914]|uniref:Histidine phosphatase family protein n=2 Tax=Lichenifustis flavocetrariae TaxID=2949735 RepID=A0AA41Z291_9HYPH|nr:histidine phosphatase family protein [Lichenifustis flavocetrariae]